MSRHSKVPQGTKPQRKPKRTYTRAQYDLNEYQIQSQELYQAVLRSTHLIPQQVSIPPHPTDNQTMSMAPFPHFITLTGPQPDLVVPNMKILDKTNPDGRRVAVAYIDSQDMQHFDTIADFDCRRIKLINYGRPALSISYSYKHRYQVKRNLPSEARRDAAQQRLEQLHQQAAAGQPVDRQEKALLEEIKLFPERFEMVLSSYHRYYLYPFVTCRFRNAAGGHDSLYTQLIQGWNILFIDTQGEAPRRDDEEILAYLAQFDFKLRLDKLDAFFRRR